MLPSVIPLTETHLLCLHTRTHLSVIDLSDREMRRALLKGDAFAVTDRGEVYAAAGVMPMWAGVGWGWAIVSVPTGKARLLYVTRAIKKYLRTTDRWQRIQTTVCADFNQGVRWAYDVLSFTPEGKLAKYGPDGRDHLMFARTY